jgi:RNA recognition motif-containing protein
VFNREIAADWADQAEEPDEETMAKVKVLYVRNLSSEITDEDVKKKFEVYGAIEHVRKLKDFAFVHFIERESALKAIEELNGQLFGKHNMDITLARPLSDKKKQMQQKRDDTKRFTGFKSSGGANQLMPPFNKNNRRAGAKNIGNLMQQNFNNPNQQNSSFNEFFAAMGNFMKGFGVNNRKSVFLLLCVVYALQIVQMQAKSTGFACLKKTICVLL